MSRRSVECAVRCAAWVAVVAAATGVTGCAADPNDAVGAPSAPVQTGVTGATDPGAADVTYPANGQTADVLAIDNTFGPELLTVVAGTEVIFTNNGRNPHNVLPEGDADALTWGVLEQDFLPTDVYSHVFDRPGTYVYYCSIHGTPKAAMHATIVVTAP